MAYSGYTEAHKEANKRYMQNYEVFQVRLPKGTRERIKANADKVGKSLNAYVADTIIKQLEEDEH